MRLDITVVFLSPLVFRTEAVTPAVLANINTKLDNIMSAVSEFNTKLNAFLDQQADATQGITEDIQFLKDELDRINNSPGPISAEDQASLDASLERVRVAQEKLTALNALTPPKAPPVE